MPELVNQAKKIANQIFSTCGVGKVLFLGDSDEVLVCELIKSGLHVVFLADENNHSLLEKFPDNTMGFCADKLDAADDSFDSIILNISSKKDIASIKAIFLEIYRVARKNLFINNNGLFNEESDTFFLRKDLEQFLMELGFRKHPAYYMLVNYESLSWEQNTFQILMEKIPEAIKSQFPLEYLRDERDLHMDMLREAGERSDAHVIRYYWASNYIRPGDAVLDAACGLGYGSYVLEEITQARSMTGIDGSQYAVNYANTQFAKNSQRLKFIEGYLPDCLKGFKDASFDVIVSFETLEHVEDPEALLAEFSRLLTPGGRIIVSVPNDWSDETGKDPNPFHLHVYTFEKLKSQLEKSFLIEASAQQIASGCKAKDMENKWTRMPRRLRNITAEAELPDSEWWLMVGIKDPSAKMDVSYQETVYGYTQPPANLLAFDRDYENPWLVRSMVEFPFRAQSPEILKRIASSTLHNNSGKSNSDAGAALAIIGYQILDQVSFQKKTVCEFISTINSYLSSPYTNAHQLRWHISLNYLAAQLFKKIGELNESYQHLLKVVAYPVLEFSPTLGTKIIDAHFEAGMIAYSRDNISSARKHWKNGIEDAFKFIRLPIEEFIGDKDYPQIFSTVLAVEILDSVIRCVKALRFTNKNSNIQSRRIFSSVNENWKTTLLARWNIINEMDSMIRARDDAIQSQSKTLDQYLQDLRAAHTKIDLMNESATSMERMLLERWNIIQGMESMIKDRDQTIIDQAKMLDQRWAILQSVENLLFEKENQILAQKEIIDSQFENIDGLNERISGYERHVMDVKNAFHIMRSAPSFKRVMKQINNSNNTLPFIDLSLTLYIFIAKLYDKATKAASKNLFFFAREGFLLKKMFDIYQMGIPDEKRIKTHYLKVSRRSTFLLSLEEIEVEKFEVLFRQYRKISLNSFLKSLALEEFTEEISVKSNIAIQEFELIRDDLPTDPIFKTLITSDAFKSTYERERKSRSKAFLKYILKLLKSDFLPETLHVVDVGWKGSIQDNLFNWLRQNSADAKIQGYYIGLIAKGSMSDSNMKEGLLFSNIGGFTPGFNIFNENRSLFEVMLHANHGSAQKYVELMDGNIDVVHDEYKEQAMIEKLIEPVSQAVIKKFEQIAHYCSLAEYPIEEIISVGLSRHYRMVFSPSPQEIQWILSISHVENFGVFETSTFGAPDFSKNLLNKYLFTKSMIRNRSLNISFWPWLTIRQSALPGFAYLYKQYRKWQNL